MQSVALHMECVDLSIDKCFFRIYGNVALHMECVDLSRQYRQVYPLDICRTPHGVRGFEYIKRKTENFSSTGRTPHEV